MADGATLPLSLPAAMTLGPDGNLYGSNLGLAASGGTWAGTENYFALTLGGMAAGSEKGVRDPARTGQGHRPDASGRLSPHRKFNRWSPQTKSPTSQRLDVGHSM